MPAQEDVFAVLEDVLPPVFEKYGTYNTASKAPFRRISYHDAMDGIRIRQAGSAYQSGGTGRYRVPGRLRLWPLRRQTVKAVVFSDFKATRKVIDKICADTEVQTGNKAYWFRLDENGELVGGISKFVTERKDAGGSRHWA